MLDPEDLAVHDLPTPPPTVPVTAQVPWGGQCTALLADMNATLGCYDPAATRAAVL
jgi:hypothetical protein